MSSPILTATAGMRWRREQCLPAAEQALQTLRTPRLLQLRTIKGLHLISELVKYYAGNGLQLSVTGNLILVSCGAMLPLPVKA